MSKQKETPIIKVINKLMVNGISETQARTMIAKKMGFHRNNITNIIKRGGFLPKTNIQKWVELTGMTIDELFPPQKATK